MGGVVTSLLLVLFIPLVYLGWGRGGILGEGSSVVELGEDPVLLGASGDLAVPCTASGSFSCGVGGVDPLDFS